MVSKQTVQVLIEAEENVSKVAKKAEEAIKKMGNAGKNGLSKLSSITSKVSSGFNKLTSWVNNAREKFNAFTSSSNKLGMIKSAITGAAGSFGQLINNSNLASRAMEKIKSVSDGIQAKFTSLKSKITGFGSSVKTSLTNAFSFSNIKSKLTSLGGSIDKLKAKMKTLAAEAKKTGGNGGLGFLRQAASMTVGMLGYDLVGSVMETARASLNARSSMQAFANRLKMNASEVSAYQKSLDDLQSSFKKVDMDVVGQQATDMAYRLGLPKTSLTELTETTAIFTDAMQRNGRSAEDSMLAMSDAMDGQFVRLKEIGIGQDDLMRNGWDGDINNKTGLLEAMNKALKEQHYDDLAKSVDTLDDAWQVLSITLGNLVESILLPLTPIIVGIINGLMGAVEGIKGFISTLQDAFNGLPDWAKYGIAIAAIAIGVGLAIAAFGGLEAILLSVASAFAPVIAAVTAISLPVVAVVAAIGLLIAAIYEAGKAFGWWTDVGSMFEAIGAGIQRMWDAFINHPDVQAAIQAITGALQWLSGAIGNAFNEIMKFFGVSSGNKWDIVHDIIMVIGAAWDTMRGKIVLAIDIIKIIIGAFQSLWGIISSTGATLSEIFAPIWTGLIEIFSTVWTHVSNLVSIFQQFQDGQISLSTMLIMIWNTLVSMFSSIISSIVTMVFNFANNLTGGALTAGANFVNGIINWIRQLPGRVYAFLVQTATRITTAGTRWVAIARVKANLLVLTVINFLRTLPGKVYSALISVVSRITGAISAWISAARSKVHSVISAITSPFNGVVGKIQGALNGVKNAITAPFQAAWNAVKPIVDKIQGALKIIPGVAGAAGGDDDEFSGNAPFKTQDKKLDVVLSGNSDLNLNLNVNGLPSGVDEDAVISILNDVFNDPDWKNSLIMEIVKSSVFQRLDAKEKLKISGISRRARGV